MQTAGSDENTLPSGRVGSEHTISPNPLARKPSGKDEVRSITATPHGKQQNSVSLESRSTTAYPAQSSEAAKRNRRAEAEPKYLPAQYEKCDVNDLVQLIGGMLFDLIQINDKLPLQDDALTRFHSRVPPGISVLEYLQRLTIHASLSPPILLSMVYYIDKLCALYPAFTITSLTVHRYLIASATVASKGLSDTFWTNGTYARVGGVSIKELGLLELELLRRIDWRIVPKPEILVEYYRSLVDRSDGFQLVEEDVGTEAAGVDLILPATSSDT